MATIHDVAKRARVSTATVSRVINDRFGVGAEARKRVMAAASDLNYRPHSAACNLRRARDPNHRELTHAIGYLTARETVIGGDPFAREMAVAVERALCERGFGIQIIAVSPEGDLPLEVKEAKVDGVLCRLSGSLMQAVTRQTFTVNLDVDEPDAGAFSLVPDYGQGVYETMLRLLRAGHRRPAVLTDRPAEKDTLFFSVFARGCLRALAEAGVPAGQGLFQGGAGTPEDGYVIGCRLFADRNAWPDVVMGPDGAMIGVYRAALERGVRIPKDVSMVGINNLAISSFLAPPLTSLDVNVTELARKGTRILSDCIETGTQRKGLELTPVELCVRDSAKL